MDSKFTLYFLVPAVIPLVQTLKALFLLFLFFAPGVRMEHQEVDQSEETSCTELLQQPPQQLEDQEVDFS